MKQIEILKKQEWKDTGWKSFEQIKEFPFTVYKEWSDDNYNYLLAEFLDELELYRQKAKICKCECKSCCRPEKTIFVYGSTKRQAIEYIRTNVIAVTDSERLRGYNKESAILVLLPQGKEQIVSQARARDFKIIEA